MIEKMYYSIDYYFYLNSTTPSCSQSVPKHSRNTKASISDLLVFLQDSGVQTRAVVHKSVKLQQSDDIDGDFIWNHINHHIRSNNLLKHVPKQPPTTTGGTVDGAFLPDGWKVWEEAAASLSTSCHKSFDSAAKKMSGWHSRRCFSFCMMTVWWPKTQ